MDFERFVMTGRSGESSRKEMVRVGAVLLFLVGIVMFLTSRAGQVHFSLVVAAMIGGFFILDDPIFNGLAVSLIFGILVSTLLTLVVIPVLYFAAFRRHHPSSPA